MGWERVAGEEEGGAMGGMGEGGVGKRREWRERKRGGAMGGLDNDTIVSSMICIACYLFIRSSLSRFISAYFPWSEARVIDNYFNRLFLSFMVFYS